MTDDLEPALRRQDERRANRALRLAALALVVGAVGLVGALTIGLGVLGNNGELERQREGRRIAVNVTCGAISAVIDAGRATITGGAAGLPPELASFLEAHGYPPAAERRRQALEAASTYARSIAKAVERASGRDDLVQPNGRLRCERLAEQVDSGQVAIAAAAAAATRSLPHSTPDPP